MFEDLAINNKDILGVTNYNKFCLEDSIRFTPLDPTVYMSIKLMIDLLEDYMPVKWSFYVTVEEHDDKVWLKRRDYILQLSNLSVVELRNKIYELRKANPNSFLGFVTSGEKFSLSYYYELAKELYPDKEIAIRWPKGQVGLTEDYPAQ